MTMAISFDSLSEREILSLAIDLEEQDGRIYGDFAEGLRENFPASAQIFLRMREEEVNHRERLLETYQQKYGDHRPLIRREDVKGFVKRRPQWISRPLRLEAARKAAATMEAETRQFYLSAAKRSHDATTKRLLEDLAAQEQQHEELAQSLEREQITPAARVAEAASQRRLFVLQVVQPGLAGLMDGSVSTLAPLFAAAFATQSSHNAFQVGLAASLGAGISMGFAEALSDDGSLTGRGKPLLRGLVCGLMTTVGGLGHTLPFLIQDFQWATRVAVVVVLIELTAISWIRRRYMDTPLLNAAVQVFVGGILVFLTGMWIGQS
jgi:rubrerythrin